MTVNRTETYCLTSRENAIVQDFIALCQQWRDLSTDAKTRQSLIMIILELNSLNERVNVSNPPRVDYMDSPHFDDYDDVDIPF